MGNVGYFTINRNILAGWSPGSKLKTLKQQNINKGLFTNYVSHIWGGSGLSVIVSDCQQLAYSPSPLCQRCQHLATPPFPSFRRFLTGKISKYIYLKQNKALLVIHSGSNRE